MIELVAIVATIIPVALVAFTVYGRPQKTSKPQPRECDSDLLYFTHHELLAESARLRQTVRILVAEQQRVIRERDESADDFRKCSNAYLRHMKKCGEKP